ncbi:MAG: nucleoside recognition protein [Fusicatenibacter sp.]|nr:nucleoside recognition protein [Lachnospiraceae bacterium]MDY2936884.1 nucleoside recognition protein [Fusicatenibacter sp.]
MNYLWGGMLLIGIVYGACTGNLNEVTEGAISASREAVMLAISLLGVTSMWTGLMEIAKKAGILEGITDKIRPFLRFLFPDIPNGHPSLERISVNLIANFFGLGAAATPPGLMAMEELERLEEERQKDKKSKEKAVRGRASKEMCTFLILNISSLQLIPVNVIAYRSQYGSVNPAAIVGPGILATTVSTAAAILFCRIMNRKMES